VLILAGAAPALNKHLPRRHGAEVVAMTPSQLWQWRHLQQTQGTPSIKKKYKQLSRHSTQSQQLLSATRLRHAQHVQCS
jgi:hypothetical protein